MTPDGRDWDVRLLEVWVGCHPPATPPRYPNPVVEREFGVAATTRGWETILEVGALLETH